MKLTKKTTANELKALLVNNADAVKTADKNLSSRVDYTINHDAKRQDLLDLVKEVMSVLGDKFRDVVSVPVAAETKPEQKTTPKKSEVKTEKTTADTKPTAENLVKKSADKTPAEEPKTETKTEAAAGKPAKKSTSKTKKVDADADTSKIEVAQKIFPETIEIDGEVFNLDHTVKSLEDLNDENKEFEFAFYWTPAHLRKFPYQSADKKQPKSFPNNLDTCQLVYVSDRGLIAYAISDSTEGFYTIYPEDLEETDGIHYANHCEFQIYSREVDADESDDDNEGDEE